LTEPDEKHLPNIQGISVKNKNKKQITFTKKDFDIFSKQYFSPHNNNNNNNNNNINNIHFRVNSKVSSNKLFIK
jgi:hypothetical protein